MCQASDCVSVSLCICQCALLFALGLLVSRNCLSFVRVSVFVVVYLSGHVGGQCDPGPEGGVDPEEHHPQADAAPDGDVAELGSGEAQ